MTLDGLLAITGILLAIVAITDSVQRRSIFLFVPVGLLWGALFLAFAVVLVMRALTVWEIHVSNCIYFSLIVFSFLAPVGMIILGVVKWLQAPISKKNAVKFADVVDAAIREAKFDEVERVLDRNRDRLGILPPNALIRVFDRSVVRALLDGRSHLHIQLLANPKFQETAGRSLFSYADNVVREYALRPNSPWRSAVLSNYGGHNSWNYLEEEQRIVESTLENPTWYVATSAHFPLLMTALEAIRSDNLDGQYNQIGRFYESQSGISARANCPVFLVEKMQVIAIRSAAFQRSDEDLYVTDLWDMFREILDHSLYETAIWEDPRANREHPTPYAYLLYQIFFDLRRLMSEAVVASLPPTSDIPGPNMRRSLMEASLASAAERDFQLPAQSPRNINPPIGIDSQVAFTWSTCALGISRAQGKVSEPFAINLLQGYLNMILQLHCAPSEIPGLGSHVTALEPWRDLLVGQLEDRFRGSVTQEESLLRKSLQALDFGKMYVYQGASWLANRLGLGPQN